MYHSGKKQSSSLEWKVTPAEGIAIQRRLAKLVSRRWLCNRIALVAGVDVHTAGGDFLRAAISILSYPSLEQVEQVSRESRCDFPYIPGLLSFREIPPILAAWDLLRNIPDVILCDGQGIAHPRGLGLASHLGVVLGIPTIGCAKSPLFGSFEEPGPFRGNRSNITDKRGRRIGVVLRTRDHIRPIYVSIGHMVSLEKAIEIVLSCTPRFRVPAPIRAAHKLASECRT